ncbi:MAG: hypothetical protein RL701_339, partial [Pseudomonadota bacterium]
SGVCAYLWTGEVPAWQVLAQALPLGLCAGVLITALYVVIGVTAFWVADVTPLYWIWQKALFILGGLMLPLELYPTWVQRLGMLTPFPLLLSGPASFVLHPQAHATHAVLLLAGRLALWLAIAGVLSHVLYERALQRLQVNGG